jgi:peptidoglycan/LPS O-acetylase OafA/YrhL
LGFLLISGYSISASIRRESAHFFARRFYRIYPMFLVGLAAAWLPFLLFGPAIDTLAGTHYQAPTARVFLLNGLMMQGFLCYVVQSNGPLWSISVEVGYYALAKVFHRLSPFWLGVCGLVSILAYGLTIRTMESFSVALYGLGWLSLLAFWLLGFWFERTPQNRLSVILLLAVPPLVLTVFRHIYDIRAPATLILVALALIFAQDIKLPRALRATANYLGELSYPVYTTHFVVLIVCSVAFQWTADYKYYFVILAVAALLHHAVERPIRHWGLKRLNRAPHHSPTGGTP